MTEIERRARNKRKANKKKEADRNSPSRNNYMAFQWALNKLKEWGEISSKKKSILLKQFRTQS